jgi:hypothetical protein
VKPITDLDANECRWPVTDACAGSPALFCGEPVADKGSYCPVHHASAYVAVPEHRRRRDLRNAMLAARAA